MTFESLTDLIGTWVSQYIAIGCLVSILLTAAMTYLFAEKWEQTVRDCGVYFLMIGTLALMLAVRPDHTTLILWTPLTWFCFTMLMVMELLWSAYLLEAFFRAMREFPAWLLRRANPDMREKGYRAGYRSGHLR